MRLNPVQQKQFIDLATRYFGESAHVYLFGSRVDDSKRGGDIDLFIETKSPVRMEQRLNFLVDTELEITQRKVDLVIKTPASIDRPIFTTAKNTGILLC